MHGKYSVTSNASYISSVKSVIKENGATRIATLCVYFVGH